MEEFTTVQTKKTTKKGPKKGNATKQEETEGPAAAGEIQFGGNNDIVNFGGGDELGEEFGEKQREPNIIRKYYFHKLILINTFE